MFIASLKNDFGVKTELILIRFQKERKIYFDMHSFFI